MCIINGALVPYLKASLLEKMKNVPYSLAVDDSSDNGLQKMNPLTVRIFDVKRGRVATQLLDMCLTSGWDGGTAAIFEKIDEKMTENEILWINCVEFGVDNASVNIGKHNSIKTRVLEKNPQVYFMGCHVIFFTTLHVQLVQDSVQLQG